MNRYKASATHLFISAAVLAGFFALVFLGWYPAPYFSIEGTYNVIVVLIGVDLVLGPLLTLIIFKPNKPGLKMDLSLIALVQITALLYGANTIYQQRPYFTVFVFNEFVVVRSPDVEKMDLTKIDPTINYKNLGPSYIYTEFPSDPAVRGKFFEDIIKAGTTIDRLPEQYRDFKSNISRSFERSLDLEFLADQYPGNRGIIDEFIARYPEQDDLAFFPLSGKNDAVVIVVQRSTGEVIDYIGLNPGLREKK